MFLKQIPELVDELDLVAIVRHFTHRFSSAIVAV
jgi:hypothetical protein